MTKTIGVAVLATVLFWALMSAPAWSYDTYHPSDTDGCFQCHPDFLGEFGGRGPLHDMHVGNQNMTGTCSLCHTNSGDNPFLYKSGGDPSHGCNGCHTGAGLRRHHALAGAPADANGRRCVACHSGDPTPAGENVLPAYYSRADVNVKFPCVVAKSSGGEDYNLNGKGLDNDGDMVYETQDADCRTTGVQDAVPARLEFAAPRPNPTRGPVTFELALPRSARVTLVVYDKAGRIVRTIADQAFDAGRHELVWDNKDAAGKPVPSGVYFVRFRTPGATETRKTVFIR